MLKALPLNTKEREQSDMADLEILGSISFDLKINKESEIKNAFVSLVSKLGTREFLEEYSILYSKILVIHKEKSNSLFHPCVSELEFEHSIEEESSSTPEEVSTVLDSCILKEISISTDYVNKI
ncbi:hypothetical protein NEMIN01_2084 [Nematocida minor]|uniref:uncharacterized protein n=1 Tax=Nematocida minor TaxID=1912983 RepID=UPI002220AB7B|nr:uncharacterized protein NEMIN01_2084 [Nematocida minor]KAI5192571.1 hypothetical protein NEMIN01_2084 [Nematocida minor]